MEPLTWLEAGTLLVIRSLWTRAICLRSTPLLVLHGITLTPVTAAQILDTIVPTLAARVAEEERKAKAAARLRLQLNTIIPDSQGGFGRCAALQPAFSPGTYAEVHDQWPDLAVVIYMSMSHWLV
jgi:hypothetical protein